MKNDDCMDIQMLLPWYLNDTLGQEERVKVAAHLAGCPSCRKELAEISKIEESIQNRRGEEILPVDEMLDAVLESIEEEESQALNMAQELLDTVLQNPVSPPVLRMIATLVKQRLRGDTRLLWKYSEQIFKAIKSAV